MPEARLDHISVAETYASIQGESTFAGLPCFFVRLAGCNLRCAWCDTSHAFEGGEPRSVDDLLQEVRRAGLRHVELTGGEPLLQPRAFPLMERLLEEGHVVLLETNGSRDISAVPSGVRIIMDLKPPSSGETGSIHWENLEHLPATGELKVVVADRADYLWARELVIRRRLYEAVPVLFSPVAGRLPPLTLAGWLLEDRLSVRLQLQLHKVLWPADARGV